MFEQPALRLVWDPNAESYPDSLIEYTLQSVAVPGGCPVLKFNQELVLLVARTLHAEGKLLIKAVHINDEVVEVAPDGTLSKHFDCLEVSFTTLSRLMKAQQLVRLGKLP